MKLNAYIDGGSRGNPGPSAAAFVLTDEDDNVLIEQGYFLGERTNNEAEYMALIELLRWLGKHKDFHKTKGDSVHVRCDSLLLVNQVTGTWKVKEPRMKELHAQVTELKKKQPFKLFIRHVTRDKNTLSDRLVNEVLDKAAV